MNSQTIRQSTSVAIGERALLIEGPPGSGKTSLALALIDRGAVLIGDDAVSLSASDNSVIASSPPNTAGLIEIRNVGIARMPTATAPVSLIVDLDPEAPRFVEKAGEIEILGQTIPFLKFAVGGIADAVRVEHALKLHGLAHS